MIGDGEDYPAIERAAAARFGASPSAAGVERMIYLGGLGDEETSKHLERPPRDGRGARRRGPAADLLPRRDGDRAGQRVVRAPARDRRAAAGAAGARLAAHEDAADRRRATWSTTCARRSTCPSRRAARSRSAAPRWSATSSSSTRWRGRSGRRPPRRIPMSGEVARPATVAAGAGAVTSGDPEVASQISLGLTTPTVVDDPSGAELFTIRPGAPRRGARRGDRRRRGGRR